MYTFDPQFTSGFFQLLIGLNTPVSTAKEEPAKGSQIAAIDPAHSPPVHYIQMLNLRLSADNNFTFHQLRTLRPGDRFSARLERNNGQPSPRLFLGDSAGKPLVFGKTDKSSVTLDYEAKGVDADLMLYIDGSPLMPIPDEYNYRITLGINAPSDLKDVIEETGQPVVKNSSNVDIGLSIDQIVNVDQQNESFSVVASLQLIWQDPALAFSPDTCNCSVKKFELNDLISLAADKKLILPVFTIFNQQGNR